MLLLDEPFGALDVQTKEDMQVLIRQVWPDTGTTVLMVTHDVEEAVFLGERVIVLASNPGRMVAEIEVELPRDRELTIKRAPEFLALRGVDRGPGPRPYEAMGGSATLHADQCG